MDIGFYHPSRGYWQAIDGASEDVRAEYPEGTIEVPLKPGEHFDWVGGEWVAVAPPPPLVPQELSFAQLLIGLVAEGWITESEGNSWLAGTLPAAVLELISTLPSGQQFAAKARASRPSTVVRQDPLLMGLAIMQGKTPEELDQFFITYAGV